MVNLFNVDPKRSLWLPLWSVAPYGMLQTLFKAHKSYIMGGGHSMRKDGRQLDLGFEPEFVSTLGGQNHS